MHRFLRDPSKMKHESQKIQLLSQGNSQSLAAPGVMNRGRVGGCQAGGRGPETLWPYNELIKGVYQHDRTQGFPNPGPWHLQDDSFMCAQSLSLVWPFCDPMDCSPPGSSIHEIFHVRILEWVAISFSRGSSQPKVTIFMSLALQADSLPLSHQGYL